MHLVLTEIAQEILQMTSEVVKSCFEVFLKRFILFLPTIENRFQFAFSKRFY